MASENNVPSRSQQQPNVPHNACNGLLKTARSALTAKNREKAQNMRADINAVWNHVDNTAVGIGEKYNKTVLSVQQAIGSGTALSSCKHSKINPWCAYLHVITMERREQGSSGCEFYLLRCMCLFLTNGI
jgi:hypothetical protein